MVGGDTVRMLPQQRIPGGCVPGAIQRTATSDGDVRRDC